MRVRWWPLPTKYVFASTVYAIEGMNGSHKQSMRVHALFAVRTKGLADDAIHQRRQCLHQRHWLRRQVSRSRHRTQASGKCLGKHVKCSTFDAKNGMLKWNAQMECLNVNHGLIGNDHSRCLAFMTSLIDSWVLLKCFYCFLNALLDFISCSFSVAYLWPCLPMASRWSICHKSLL